MPRTPFGVAALRFLALLNLLPLTPLLEDDDLQTVLTFRAREYGPGKRDFVFETSRELTREQVEEICGKIMKKIQEQVDKEYDELKNSGLSKSQIGTAVHKALENWIKGQKNSNLSAEVSFQKALDEGVVPKGTTKDEYERSLEPGGKGSIRIDIEIKVPEKDLICFPDIKTGKKGFSFTRMRQFVDRASKVPENEDLKRIIMIEVRPKK
jgi:hypothetical protein